MMQKRGWQWQTEYWTGSQNKGYTQGEGVQIRDGTGESRH